MNSEITAHTAASVTGGGGGRGVLGLENKTAEERFSGGHGMALAEKQPCSHTLAGPWEGRLWLSTSVCACAPMRVCNMLDLESITPESIFSAL